MSKNIIIKKTRLNTSKILLITYLSFTASTVRLAYAQNIDNKKANVIFNFSNADIESVIKTVALASGKTIIIDPRVRGTISFNSEKAVTPTQSLSVLASILRMNGFAMVEENGFVRVVPDAEAKSFGNQVIIKNNKNINKNHNNGQVNTQIFNIKYESANSILNMVRNLISPSNINTIALSPNSNSLIITDYSDNLTKISKIIASLDKPKDGKAFEVITLKNANANEVAALVSKLFDTNNPELALKTNIIVDNRSNSIILSAHNPQKINQLKSLIANLDKPSNKSGNGNIWVVALKNADANSVAQTLRAVMSGKIEISNTTNNISNSNTFAANNTNNSSNNSNSEQPSNSINNSFGGQVQADVATNSIIITANEVQYKNLRDVITHLDTKRAQVFVESMIVEISTKKAEELGIQWQGLLGGGANRIYLGNGVAGSSNIGQVGVAANDILNLGTTSNSSTISNLAGIANGFNVGWLHQFGSTLGLAGLAKALSNQSGVNILSTPNLLTLDNQEAKIIIGQNVPFITGQYTNGNSGNSANVNPFQTIERNDVGLTLKVKPQVSANNKVKLKIYQEVSSVDDKSNAAGIITNKRSIDTTVEVNNGQAIVLGGLLEDSYSNNVSKVPVLGNIPVLGALFRYEKKSRDKKNLMLFLRPYVVYDNAQELTISRYDSMRQSQLNYQPDNMLLSKESYPLLINKDNSIQLPKSLDGMSINLKNN